MERYYTDQSPTQNILFTGFKKKKGNSFGVVDVEFAQSYARVMTFPDSSAGKESACNVRDPGLIPGLGRSPGERKGYPLQYSGLENSMDCIVHGITKRRTRLSDFTMPTSTVLWISSLEPPLECCLCCDWKA